MNDLVNLYAFAQTHKDCFTKYNGIDVQVYQNGQQINILNTDMLALKAYTFEKEGDKIVVRKYNCVYPGVINYDRCIETEIDCE